MTTYSGEQVMSGTYAELWINGEKVAEAKSFEAKVEFEKEDVKMLGSFWADAKTMGCKGTGSLKLLKTNSRMALLLKDVFNGGAVPRFSILSKLNDPAADGAERVMIKGVSFDDLAIANWEAGAMVETDNPFTFNGFEFYDTVSPR